MTDFTFSDEKLLLKKTDELNGELFFSGDTEIIILHLKLKRDSGLKVRNLEVRSDMHVFVPHLNFASHELSRFWPEIKQRTVGVYDRTSVDCCVCE